MNSRGLIGLELCAAIALLAVSMSIDAQPVIEEIIVTAQKREQSLQDVPLAVSAYDAASLSRSGVRDLRDLQQLSPSLVLTSTQSESAGTTARLRGIGTTGDNLGLESSVAVFVDGVFRNRNSVALTDLGALERIEVLRGPQGTLFGRNASAGLSQVITAGPDLEQAEGYLSVSYGRFDEYRLGGGFSTPLVEGRSAIGLDGVWTQRDGFIDDTVSGDTLNNRDRWALRGQFAGLIGENLDLRLIVDSASRDEDCCAAVTTIAGNTAAIINGLTPLTGFQPLGTVIVPPRPFDRETTITPGRGYNEQVDEWGTSLELNWDVGVGTLTSISAYRDWDSSRSQDADYTNADIVYRVADAYGNRFKTLTQEVRYAWTSGDFDLMVGGYYLDEQLETVDAIRVGADYLTYVNALAAAAGEPTLPAGAFVDGQGAQRDAFVQDTQSIALFTHNTWRATDRLSLTLGLRYTDEDKDVSAQLLADNPACLGVAGGQIPVGPTGFALTCLSLISPITDGSYAGARNDSEWTGTVVADYQFNDQWLGYASFSRGFKVGGYNLDRSGLDDPLPPVPGLPEASDLEFRPEVVDSWELGFKRPFLDNRLNLNAALFFAQFDDFQLNLFNGLNFIVFNLEEVTSKGVETELRFAVREGLTLTGGASYTDARYDEGITEPVDPTTAETFPLAGRRLTNAPRTIVTSSLSYERGLGRGFMGFTRLDYRYQSDANTGSDLDPEKIQPAFSLWNGSVGVASPGRGWEVELWFRNLFDEDYRQVVIDSPLQPGSFTAFLGDPRTWGIRGRLSF